jgi:hypothetical protein
VSQVGLISKTARRSLTHGNLDAKSAILRVLLGVDGNVFERWRQCTYLPGKRSEIDAPTQGDPVHLRQWSWSTLSTWNDPIFDFVINGIREWIEGRKRVMRCISRSNTCYMDIERNGSGSHWSSRRTRRSRASVQHQTLVKKCSSRISVKGGNSVTGKLSRFRLLSTTHRNRPLPRRLQIVLSPSSASVLLP